jgi:hypothetical protein
LRECRRLLEWRDELEGPSGVGASEVIRMNANAVDGDGRRDRRRELLRVTVLFPVATLSVPFAVAPFAPSLGLAGLAALTGPAALLVLFLSDDKRHESAKTAAFANTRGGNDSPAAAHNRDQEMVASPLMGYLWGLAGFGIAAILFVTFVLL